jgi:membrane dipeptidase
MPFLRANVAPTTDDLIRHLSHAVDVCGEDHVGIGSDVRVTPIELTPEFKATHLAFVRGRRAAGTMAPGEAEDVYNYVPELNSARRMDLIADALAKAGHSSSRIEKILGANWLRLFREVWR